MRWCCPQFEGLMSFAGKRGFAIIVDASKKPRLKIMIQFRCWDAGAEPSDIPQDLTLMSAEEVGIQFCPWCGVRLREWYDDSLYTYSRPDLRVFRL